MRFKPPFVHAGSARYGKTADAKNDRGSGFPLAERSSVAAPRAASERYGGRADTRASASPSARRYAPYGFSGRHESGIYGTDARRAARRRIRAAAGGIPRFGNAETGDILEAADFGAGCFRSNRPLRFLYYRSIFSAS